MVANWGSLFFFCSLCSIDKEPYLNQRRVAINAKADWTGKLSKVTARQLDWYPFASKWTRLTLSVCQTSLELQRGQLFSNLQVADLCWCLVLVAVVVSVLVAVMCWWKRDHIFLPLVMWTKFNNNKQNCIQLWCPRAEPFQWLLGINCRSPKPVQWVLELHGWTLKPLHWLLESGASSMAAGANCTMVRLWSHLSGCCIFGGWSHGRTLKGKGSSTAAGAALSGSKAISVPRPK